MATTPDDRTFTTTHAVDECSACSKSHIDLTVTALANGSGHFYICPENGDPALVDIERPVRAVPSSPPRSDPEPQVREYGETGVVELSGDVEVTAGATSTATSDAVAPFDS